MAGKFKRCNGAMLKDLAPGTQVSVVGKDGVTVTITPLEENEWPTAIVEVCGETGPDGSVNQFVAYGWGDELNMQNYNELCQLSKSDKFQHIFA